MNLPLQVGLAWELVRAEADPDRISQVLINLIGNGLQYTPAGGQVDVDIRRKNNGALVTIADTGAGIDAEHLPYLFTRFYRVDKSRARAGGGSGIGLDHCPPSGRSTWRPNLGGKRRHRSGQPIHVFAATVNRRSNGKRLTYIFAGFPSTFT